LQDDINTSVWAPGVQAYTRMFYARYGAGTPGQTPWRLGRGLQAPSGHAPASAPARGGSLDAAPRQCSTTDSGQRRTGAGHDASASADALAANFAAPPQQQQQAFLTEAHIELQAKAPHTSLALWQQYSSQPVTDVNLTSIKAWATAMRPRSIHDLKPMLMLCQALLRDLAGVHERDAATGAAAVAAEWAARLDAAEARRASETAVRFHSCQQFMQHHSIIRFPQILVHVGIS
jgi:hypothetical protein